MNKAILIGRLSQNPKGTITLNGTIITKFSITTDNFFNLDSMNNVHESKVTPVVAFENQAAFCVNNLRKGDLILIEGIIQNKKWQDRIGKYKCTIEICAKDIQLLEPMIQKNICTKEFLPIDNKNDQLNIKEISKKIIAESNNDDFHKIGLTLFNKAENFFESLKIKYEISQDVSIAHFIHLYDDFKYQNSIDTNIKLIQEIVQEYIIHHGCKTNNNLYIIESMSNNIKNIFKEKNLMLRIYSSGHVKITKHESENTLLSYSHFFSSEKHSFNEICIELLAKYILNVSANLNMS